MTTIGNSFDSTGQNNAFIETFGTNKVPIEEIYNYVRTNFNFSVQNMIDELNLLRPIYYDLASYGHFGRIDLDLPWEKLDKVDALKAYL